MNQLSSLRDVLFYELEDLYSAEKQIVEALPMMAEQATSTRLRETFEAHLTQTEEHVQRLEHAAKKLEIEFDTTVCEGMKGLLKEGQELLKMDPCDAVDAALISAAQRVEHYEMAVYGSAIAFAQTLEEKVVEKLLTATLKEEEKADEKLSTIAESEVNENAAEEMEDSEEVE